MASIMCLRNGVIVQFLAKDPIVPSRNPSAGETHRIGGSGTTLRAVAQFNVVVNRAPLRYQAKKRHLRRVATTHS